MRLSPALTLIELMLVIALVTLLGAAALYSFSGMRQNQALKFSADSVVAELTRAHIFSRENKDEKSWGVKADGFTGYALMARDSTGEETITRFNLAEPVTFARDDYDIWFDQVTGETVSAVTIELLNPRGGSRIISVSQFGTIQIQP